MDPPLPRSLCSVCCLHETQAIISLLPSLFYISKNNKQFSYKLIIMLALMLKEICLLLYRKKKKGATGVTHCFNHITHLHVLAFSTIAACVGPSDGCIARLGPSCASPVSRPSFVSWKKIPGQRAAPPILRGAGRLFPSSLRSLSPLVPFARHLVLSLTACVQLFSV